MRSVSPLFVSATSVLLACGTEPGPTEGPTPPPPPAPPTFELEVAVRTEGINLDPDGYTISIDSVPRPIASQGSLRVSGLRAGSHTVRIFGLSMNCRVPLGLSTAAPTPRDEAWEFERQVEAVDGPMHVDFVVQCYEVGTLELVILGDNPGPTQFTVTMTHDPRQVSVRRGAKTKLESVSAGEHTIWIRPNCAFTSSYPVTRIVIPAGGTVRDTVSARRQPCIP